MHWRFTPQGRQYGDYLRAGGISKRLSLVECLVKVRTQPREKVALSHYSAFLSLLIGCFVRNFPNEETRRSNFTRRVSRFPDFPRYWKRQQCQLHLLWICWIWMMAPVLQLLRSRSLHHPAPRVVTCFYWTWFEAQRSQVWPQKGKKTQQEEYTILRF